MSDDDGLRRFVVRDEKMPGEFELLLDGIRFMRAELGEQSGSLPESLEAAELEYAELKLKVEPPTIGQVAEVSSLLKKTGGIMTGEVHSRRHAEILIEELRHYLTEQRGMANVQAHRSNRVHGSEANRQRAVASGEWLGPVVAAGILLPWGVCLFLWFEATIVWTGLAVALLFVVGGGFYVLGLWR